MRTLMPLVLSAGAIAQTTQVPLTLRVNTRLVQFTVVVTDGHRNPVADLKSADFAVYDNGKKQEIRIFEVEDYRQVPAVSQPAVPNLRAIPGAFSNRVPMEPGGANPVTVIVIDAGATWDSTRMTWPELVYARDQLIQFLRQVHPEDRLGIYLVGPRRFWILREYNQTCAELLDKLATWRTPAEAPAAAKASDVWAEFAMRFAGVDAETARAIHRDQFWTSHPGGGEALPEGMSKDSADGPISRPAPGSSMATTGSMATTSREVFLTPEQGRPLTALAGVARHLAAVPGRKNLILISGQMFLPREFKDQIALLRDVIQTGVTVYPIDPGGLAPYTLDASLAIPSKTTAFDSNAGLGAVQKYIGQSEETNRLIIAMLQSSLLTLADATGGKAFVNSNSIRDAILSSFEDSRVTYTLGFYPKTENDGSYHTIKVKIPGREHLTARHRDGYFEPEPPRIDQKQRQGEIQTAVWSPVDATGIGLSGTLRASAAPNTYDLKLNIVLANVSLKSEAARWNGQIEVNMVGRDNAGNTYDPLSQTLGLNLRQESYEKMLKDGLPYGKSLQLDPRASSLRVIVRDRNGGNLGTVTIPLTGL
jgi:VWFA-related protein